MKINALFLWVVFVLHSSMAMAQTAAQGDPAFTKLCEKYVNTALSFLPVDASYIGFHTYDGQWPDFSPTGVTHARQRFAELQKTFSQVNKQKLSSQQLIDLELVNDSIASNLFSFNELKSFEWDPQSYNEAVGAGFDYLSREPKNKVEWSKRLQAINARLKGLPKFLETAAQNLKQAPKVYVEFVIENNPGNKEMLQKQVRELFTGHAKEKAEFEKLLPAALSAIDHFQVYLEKDLLPKATFPWQLGPDKWQKKLRHSLSSTVAPDLLYHDAEKGLAATRQQMLKVAMPLFEKEFAGDTSYQKLQGDERLNYIVSKVLARASLKHGSASSLFTDVKRYIEKITGFIKQKDLITLPPPNDNFVIEPTPPYLDGMAVAFFNPAPALDPDLKKSYWISTVPKSGSGDPVKDAAFAESFLREYNEYGLQTLTIHEAFPGHYVQGYITHRSPSLSLMNRVTESGTMEEGWAVLIEDIMYEQGYAKDEPENLLTHYKMNLRSYLNAMIDQRLHTSGEPEAKLDQWALDLLEKYGFQEEAEAKRKIRRAKLSSTQLSTYFVGYREMKSIYEDARKKAGLNAPLKPILDKMLSYGAIPPRMIREQMSKDGLL